MSDQDSPAGKTAQFNKDGVLDTAAAKPKVVSILSAKKANATAAEVLPVENVVEMAIGPATETAAEMENKPSDTEASLPAQATKEFGGQKGPEPTRFGDWEKNGRCTDF